MAKKKEWHWKYDARDAFISEVHRNNLKFIKKNSDIVSYTSFFGREEIHNLLGEACLDRPPWGTNQ